MKKKKGNTHEHSGEGDVMRNDPPTNVFRHTLRGKHAISCWSSGIKVISWLWQELHENVLDWLILCKEHRSFYPKARGHYVFLSACPPASIFPLFLSLPVHVYPAYVCLLVCSVFLSVWPSLVRLFFPEDIVAAHSCHTVPSTSASEASLSWPPPPSADCRRVPPCPRTVRSPPQTCKGTMEAQTVNIITSLQKQLFLNYPFLASITNQAILTKRYSQSLHSPCINSVPSAYMFT